MTQTPSPGDALPTSRPPATTVHGLVEAQARSRPDAVALGADDSGLTYRQLEARANALARRLREHAAPGARVGLHLRRGPQVVVAALAVLKAGCAYVPLDPDYPAERLRFMTEDSGVPLVLTEEATADDVGGVPTLTVDPLDGPEPSAADARPVEVPVGPDDCAYVIYTSGSTGRPKGVVVPHGNVTALVAACDEVLDLGPDDVWTMLHSHCFDFSVWELWGALAHGSRLVVVPAETARSPRATLDLLAREGVTVLNVVPSVFRYLTRAAQRGLSAGTDLQLRYVIFGGERVDLPAAREWTERFPEADTAFYNTYGITESTVFVSFHRLTEEDLHQTSGPTNVGPPLSHLAVALLDDRRRPVPDGATGEIWVAGRGVAQGYLGRPDLTAERFVELTLDGRPRRYYRSGDLARRRPDGALEFVGRADDQIKLRGFRIEPGEIEAVLRTVPGLDDLAVVAAENPLGEPVLVAWYVAQEDLGPALRRAATRLLPAHMVPTRFDRLPALPLSPSGKIDRRELAARGRSSHGD